MIAPIHITNRVVGPGAPIYIVAEMSANHGQAFEQAIKLIEAAKSAGADAIKLQTYTPATLTIDCQQDCFRVGQGTLWQGRTLYDLYSDAYTPWDWQPKLRDVANSMGLDLFSTPFDASAVDFLEQMNVPAYKIASFELVDIPLIQRVAKTGKPLIMSTGMASLAEIDEAVQGARAGGADQLALLKCTSAYPAPPEEMNLRSIPHLSEAFGVPVGLSDHTLGIAVSTTAAALGACIIEKHLTLSRSIPGPDSAFSLEPTEFKAMVDAVRTAEKALGQISYAIGKQEEKSRAFRRSLFAINDIKAGEVFSMENVRSIRPSFGLPPRELDKVLGRRASQDIPRGTPLEWSFVAGYLA